MFTNPVLSPLELDGFNSSGDRDLLAVLECRLRPQNVSFAELGENILRIAHGTGTFFITMTPISWLGNSAITTPHDQRLGHFARADFRDGD